MSDVVKTPPFKHSGCKHFGLSFDGHPLCRRCTLSRGGSLHSQFQSCSICVDWSPQLWAQYNAPLPEKATGASNSGDRPKKLKKHTKGHGKARGGSATSHTVERDGATASVVPSTTVSTVSPGTGTRPAAVEGEPLINTVAMLAVNTPITATTGISVCGSQPVTPPLQTGTPGFQVSAESPVDVQQAQALLDVSLGSCARGSPQALLPLPGFTGDPHSPMISTHSHGTPVSTVAPVTTVAQMGSHLPLPTGMATLGPGSYPAQPTMTYLLQLMQGLAGQVLPQHSVAAQGIPVPGFITQPPVPRTGVGQCAFCTT